jgi:quercetin dioxygenase-like cupin family protein
VTDTDRVIVNPISGERIIVRKSGAETGGRLLAFDLFLPPGGHVPAGHVHPEQVEQFMVIDGLMKFRVRGRTVIAGPGETVAVEAGSAHWFGNPGPQTAHAYVEVRPALRMLEMFEATSAAGHFPGTRLPLPFDLAAILLEFRREVAMPHVPRFLAAALLSPLAWFSRHNHR